LRVCFRTLWSIFEANAGTNGVLLQSQIRPLLNSIGLFPSHSQSSYYLLALSCFYFQHSLLLQ